MTILTLNATSCLPLPFPFDNFERCKFGYLCTKMTLLTRADQMGILGGSSSSLVMIAMLISNLMLIF